MRRLIATGLLALLFLPPLPGHCLPGDEGERESLAALWQAGLQAFGEGNLEEAEHTFNRALELDREQPRTWNYLGGVFFQAGDFTKALLHFKQAFMLDPRDARACNNIATAYENLGRYEKAKTYYLNAIKIDRDYPVPYRNLGVLFASRMENPELARRFWKHFLKLVPSGPDADDVRNALAELGPREGGEEGEKSHP